MKKLAIIFAITALNVRAQDHLPANWVVSSPPVSQSTIIYPTLQECLKVATAQAKISHLPPICSTAPKTK